LKSEEEQSTHSFKKLNLAPSSGANYERVTPMSLKVVHHNISMASLGVPHSADYFSGSSQHPATSESDVLSYIRPNDGYQNYVQ
jgi:hypothetical protein